MTYYKVIKDNTIIDANTAFYKWQKKHNKIIECEPSEANFIGSSDGSCIWYANGLILCTECNYNFETVTMVEITEEEYEVLKEQLAADETIEVEEEETQTEVEETTEDEAEDSIETITLEYVQKVKLNTLSNACNSIIENGVDVELSDGETHHFSLTTQDQLNLITLSSMVAAGQTSIPYHADGELCKFYSPEDITTITTTATAFVTYHTSYYNSLKAYVLALTDIVSVGAVEYGMEIPEEYQSEVLSAL